MQILGGSSIGLWAQRTGKEQHDCKKKSTVISEFIYLSGDVFCVFFFHHCCPMNSLQRCQK
jgi:hypothetical protein